MQTIKGQAPVTAAPSIEAKTRAKETLMQAIAEETMKETRPGTRNHRLKAPMRLLITSAAALALVAAGIINYLPTTTSSRQNDAVLALQQLQLTASRTPATNTGAITYTKTLSNRNQRELWIAPDGSGRIREIPEAASETPRDVLYKAGDLTYIDFTGWPTDVDNVLAKLRQEASQSKMQPLDAQAFVRAGDYLRETGASPEIRAAIFGAVAKLDGVRSVGTIPDGIGRSGIGFEISSDQTHDSKWQLIFDPKTSRVLGERSGRANGEFTEWATYMVNELVSEIPPGGQYQPEKPNPALP